MREEMGLITCKKILKWFLSFAVGSIATFLLGLVLFGDFVSYNFENYRIAFIVYTVLAVLFGLSVAVLTMSIGGKNPAVPEARMEKLERTIADQREKIAQQAVIISKLEEARQEDARLATQAEHDRAQAEEKARRVREDGTMSRRIASLPEGQSAMLARLIDEGAITVFDYDDPNYEPLKALAAKDMLDVEQGVLGRTTYRVKPAWRAYMERAADRQPDDG